jgi:uncharacterized membrane protein
MMSESHIRTIVRTLTYRFLALVITALWTGLGDAVLIHIVLAVLQYITERVWLKIKWGTSEA